MLNNLFTSYQKRDFLKFALLVALILSGLSSGNIFAQSSSPKVTEIDLEGLQKLIKRDGNNSKPLLVNFWATWCAPCIVEFPDLVKIDNHYKGKIDFISVSLDETEEINTGVPRFLSEMKATMPSYLLKTPDEEATLSAISKDWQGGLPFTILYNGSGETLFIRQGLIKPEAVRAEIEKALSK